MVIELAKTFATTLTGIAWPAVVGFIAFFYRSEIRSILPRVRKAGPIGIELDAVQQQQKEAKADAPSGELKPLPGINRTKALEAVERNLHDSLKIYDENNRLDILVSYLAQARLELSFERIYRVIFGSQIEGLRHLSEVGQVSFDEARAFFDRVKEKYPELYEDYGFAGWLGFLESEYLVHRNGNFIEITDFGRDFLAYLANRRLPEGKAF